MNKLLVLSVILLIIAVILLISLLIFNKEKFISSCLGARDGVSGCRDCCSKFNPGKLYRKCVSNCMTF